MGDKEASLYRQVAFIYRLLKIRFHCEAPFEGKPLYMVSIIIKVVNQDHRIRLLKISLTDEDMFMTFLNLVS